MSRGRERSVVSVSIGSRTRDVDDHIDLLGTRVHLRRIGTGGDLEAARQLVSQLDGEVDAIGLGGTDLYVRLGARRYYIRDSVRIASAAKTTPVVCGAGLKDSLERDAVARLDEQLKWAERRVLMVNSVDRFGMAEAIHQRGADVMFGDLVFGLGIDVPLRSPEAVRRIGAVALPVITRLPFKWFYPTGAAQETTTTRRGLAEHYDWAEVVAGDWHYIRRYAPPEMRGKDVLTNTTTATDVEMLKRAGVRRLITTTPRVNGRSVGTNLLEAAIVAVVGADGELTRERYDQIITEAGLGPSIVELQG